MLNKKLWRKVAVATGTASLGLAISIACSAQVQAPPAVSTAQPVMASTMGPLTLKEAAQLAVLKNPEVLARWHQIRVAEQERNAARGGYLPRVDLNATGGQQKRSDFKDDYSTRWGQLSLTQLLYDGFTRKEVERLDHNVQARLFEFFDISEQTALEAARAYFDVLRYRALVKLAEDNFVQHRSVFSQIDEKVKAKVGRAVDLEQIQGRLALAEANLLIETANLHDTTARFQRIVGRQPSQEMPQPVLIAKDLPPDSASAINEAKMRHPALLASVENIRAANAALSSRDGAYQPRFDLRLRREQGNNQLGPVGGLGTTTAEVVMTWNLFNGFADKSRERQFAEQVNVAKDIRDKTCRDLRQTLLIAFNDMSKLREQIGYLEQHEVSVARALEAYRDQFRIGQRSLLDLLDTENERFQARRSVVNAIQDQNLAYARAQQSVGTLLRSLDLSSVETGHETDLAQWRMDGDGAQECPNEPVMVYTVDKAALTTKALSEARANPMTLMPNPASPDGRTALAQATQPGKPVTLQSAPTAAAEGDVRSALEAWRAAWASQNVDGYLKSYAPSFKPANDESPTAWSARRRAVIGAAKDVEVAISGVSVTGDPDGRVTTLFTQMYRSASYKDRTRKVVTWQRINGKWLIVSETTDTMPATAAPKPAK